jgi:hypothetical protein
MRKLYRYQRLAGTPPAQGASQGGPNPPPQQKTLFSRMQFWKKDESELAQLNPGHPSSSPLRTNSQPLASSSLNQQTFPPASSVSGPGPGQAPPPVTTPPPADDVKTGAGQVDSNAPASDEKKGSTMVGKGDFILTMIALIIGFSISILLIPCLILGILDIYRLNRMLKKEANRIESGEKVLMYDSTIYKILKYADGQNRNDPSGFSIYLYLTFANFIFIFANLAIFLLFVNFAIKIALAIEGNSLTDASDDTRFLKGFGLSIFTAIVYVIYVKYIYKRIFEDGVYKEIQNRYNALVDLDNQIYSYMISHPTSTSVPDTATDFYTKLQTDNIKGIVDNLGSLTREDDIIRQVVTLNIYEYFKKNIPNFGSSEIKTKLFTNEGIRSKNVRPSLYLRIDCTNPIVNIYHSLGLENVINANLRENVETSISLNMASINQTIAKVKLESQPVLSLFRNYLKTSTSYFLLVTFFYILIVMKMFDIRYEGSALQGLVVRIKNWFLARFGAKK